MFEDPYLLVREDEEHSRDEQRYTAIGCSVASRLLVVIHAERGDLIRIITAREATPRERTAYEG